MAKLEYRLNDGSQYPCLFQYSNIDVDEISLRFACDYLVKGSDVFEMVSTAIELDRTYVIYVERASDENAAANSHGMIGWGSIKIELRHFRGEDAHEHPLVTTFESFDDDLALLRLQTSLHYANNKEWLATSTEVDENRQVYVIYAQPTG